MSIVSLATLIGHCHLGQWYADLRSAPLLSRKLAKLAAILVEDHGHFNNYSQPKQATLPLARHPEQRRGICGFSNSPQAVHANPHLFIGSEVEGDMRFTRLAAEANRNTSPFDSTRFGVGDF